MKPLITAVLALVLATRVAAQAPAANPERDEFYRFARDLFERAAPPEVRLLYEFPAREEWDFHVGRLERALAGGSLPELAALATEARPALATLRLVPGADEVADWFEQRVDAIGERRAAFRRPADHVAAEVVDGLVAALDERGGPVGALGAPASPPCFKHGGGAVSKGGGSGHAHRVEIRQQQQGLGTRHQRWASFVDEARL